MAPGYRLAECIKDRKLCSPWMQHKPQSLINQSKSPQLTSARVNIAVVLLTHLINSVVCTVCLEVVVVVVVVVILY